MSLVNEGSDQKIESLSGDCICITSKGKPVKPKTIGQKNYCNAIKQNTITIGVGPAGTGKTYLAVAMAVTSFRAHEVNRIILTRPAVEAGEKLGFLPGDLHADLLKVCKTKKTELLFLALFIRMLKIGGRCACIVPDGVLFGSSTAHKAIRKALVEENRLEAVISMPSGVFKPYAGVSTAILIFTKTGHGGTDKVWFYDMKADGFSLDDKRTETKENDIPDIIERFRNLDKEIDRKRTEQSFFVPKEEIAENGYDLSINKYKEIEYVPVEYPSTQEIMTELHEIEMKIGEEMQALEELLGLK